MDASSDTVFPRTIANVGSNAFVCLCVWPIRCGALVSATGLHGDARIGGRAYQSAMVNSSFRSWHPSGMEKIQRRFGAGIGSWLREAVAEEGHSRHYLVRGLCEAADWRNAKEELCLASARRALPALATDLGVRLPSAREVSSAPKAEPPDSEPVPDPRIEVSLEDLGEVRLEFASGAARPAGRDRLPGRLLAFEGNDAEMADWILGHGLEGKIAASIYSLSILLLSL